MLRDALKNFPQQFAFEPEIENRSNFKPADKFILVGMGGSHLAADLLKAIRPEVDMIIWSDYGLPEIADAELRSRIVILSSYSGNTEETIDAFYKAKEKSLNMIAITVGGKLLALAKENNIPYIQIPDTGIQPRMALGFSIRALFKIRGDENDFYELGRLANDLNPADLEIRGEALAARLKNSVPVIYSSRRNYGIAYNWKIKFNETGKIPAFMNVVPELNHNEMNGFDVADATRALSRKFYFIFLRDSADDPRIQKRMTVLERLYQDRGLPVESIELEGETALHKIFSSLLLADWTAFYTAQSYGVEPEQVPMVEEFKKLIAEPAKIPENQAKNIGASTD